jgi:hypothetical protein
MSENEPGEISDIVRLLLSPFTGKKEVAVDFVAGLKISTIYAGDIQQWETAIVDANHAYPVERYESLEAAQAGHARWVAAAPTLTKVTVLGYGSLVGAEEVELVRGEQDNAQSTPRVLPPLHPRTGDGDPS